MPLLCVGLHAIFPLALGRTFLILSHWLQTAAYLGIKSVPDEAEARRRLRATQPLRRLIPHSHPWEAVFCVPLVLFTGMDPGCPSWNRFRFFDGVDLIRAMLKERIVQMS
ncbi:hypothetical protein BKA70DRAFT_1318577 [Coprinopsis sp. MPI-PUGE-AT-0042]|nr:hypothetical protein BKA70DRAFT_1318577 [Coprinopsis sp. MPI-PUGE-AT-0042]